MKMFNQSISVCFRALGSTHENNNGSNTTEYTHDAQTHEHINVPKKSQDHFSEKCQINNVKSRNCFCTYYTDAL